MKLPNSDQALIEKKKILDYILNKSHPDNGGKSAFFIKLGFSRNDWQAMAAALHKYAETAEVSKRIESQHGIKYILDGRIISPTGKTAMIRSIWIVDGGRNIPRLVTVYPHEK